MIPVSLAAQERGVSFGGRFSLNLAGIHMSSGPDEYMAGTFSRRLTLSAGLDVQYAFGPTWAVLTGLHLDRMGARYELDVDQAEFQSHWNVRAGASYLTLPLLLQFARPLAGAWTLTAAAGPYGALFLGGNVHGQVSGDVDLEFDEDIADLGKSTDWGLIIGLGLRRPWRGWVLALDLRYRWGLSNGVDEEGDVGGTDMTARASAITLSVGAWKPLRR
jgi:hypothetical protein